VRIAIATLGCKVNQYESAAIISAIPNTILVPFGNIADCYIINTCAVTAKSEHQSRQLVRRALRNNPQAKIIVTGCYTQIAADEFKKMSGISAILGNQEKGKIPQLISELEKENSSPLVRVENIQKVTAFDSLRARGIPEHSRSVLKIQDGCNACCSYCIIPLTRGRSRSMSISDVLRESTAIAELGYKETILSGIHLGAYGEDLQPPSTLVTLLEKIIASGKHSRRLRLSSLEPQEITEGLLAMMAAPASPLCPHLHIPLQSGDDEILAHMGRHYTVAFFERLINTIVAKVPNIAIGLDVIVGFPGESERRFFNTYALLERLPISYCHIFPYSPRPGTQAALLENDVEENIKKRRGEALRALSEKKREAFGKTLLGKTIDILLESKLDKETGYIKGVSGNYQKVIVRNVGLEYANKVVEATVENTNNGKLIALLQKVVD